MNNPPLVVERTYGASPERIWQALTDPEQIRKWYFDIPEFRAEPGFKFSFTAGSETKQYLHLCTVTTVEPGRKLSYTWRYDGYPGNSEVSWELFPEGSGTRVVITHVGLETFPQTGDFDRKNFNEGWTYFLDKALPNYLES